MGNVIHWFKDLNFSVLSRRGKVCTNHRSDRNHPENIDAVERVPGQQNKAESNAIVCSPFYVACRNNDLEKVKRLSKTLTLCDIDKIEPNGSTALHAASYHGRREIVAFLLKLGADRSVQNKFGCLPYDEANDEETRELFVRIPSMNRLVSDTGAIEWERIDDDASNAANNERLMIKALYDRMSVVGGNGIRGMFEAIEKNYINKTLAHVKDIDKIQRFFQKATEEEDPEWMIKAYTAETDFYKVLNQELAGGSNKNRMEQTFIVALFLHHPKLDPRSYIGTSCRVMRITEETLEKYKTKPRLMVKTFMSSSIEEKIAVWFAHRANSASENSPNLRRFNLKGNLIFKWVLCKYTIKNRRSALNIENISQYAMEGEILIMPYTVFQVKNISEVRPSFMPDDYSIQMIEIEECDEYST